MCLTTEQKEPIILDKDMVVYKRTEAFREITEFRAQDNDFSYPVGKLMETEIKESEEKSFTDSVAYDKYHEIYDSKKIHEFFMGRNDLFKSLGQGFHSYESYERCEMMWIPKRHFIGKFVIPTGASIYKDESGLIVSNKIKFIKYL